MSISNKFKPKGGFWKQQHDGLVKWCETDYWGNILKLYNPLDIINISKEAFFKITFIKETENPESFKKTKRYFAIDCHIALRSDVSENIVLKFSSGRYYISDLKELGFTCEIDIENSTDTLILQKSEPYLINATLMKEYLKIWSYGFGKVIENENGLEFYRTV